MKTIPFTFVYWVKVSLPPRERTFVAHWPCDTLLLPVNQIMFPFPIVGS